MVAVQRCLRELASTSGAPQASFLTQMERRGYITAAWVTVLICWHVHGRPHHAPPAILALRENEEKPVGNLIAKGTYIRRAPPH